MPGNTNQLPKLTAEKRRAASGQFERANQVVVTRDYDYGIQLLLECCRLDPANTLYRQTLRKTVKAKFDNNLRGSALAFVTTFFAKMRVKSALRRQDYVRVLEQGELVLVRNPWDIPTQIAMAKSFIGLGLLDLAIWELEQVREGNTKVLKVNRLLAQLYEKRGNFSQAMSLWEWVKKTDPNDHEAQDKAKDIAASATIAKGRYKEMIESGEHSAMSKIKSRKSESHIATEEYTPSQSADEIKSKHQETDGDYSDRANRELAAMEERIQTDPSNPNAYLQLATWYKRKERWEKAWEVLDDGLAPTGHHFEMQLEMADLEIEPHRRNLAITEEKLVKKPGDAELLKIKTNVKQEILTRELNIFRQKAERYPTDKSHRFEMGLRLLQLGQTDEAIQELQTARTDPRLQSKAVFYLGFCFKQRNNWRLAERNFEEALRLLPANDDELRKETLFELATGNAKYDQLAKAVDYGYELANLDFSFRNIGKLIDDWQTRLQNA